MNHSRKLNQQLIRIAVIGAGRCDETTAVKGEAVGGAIAQAGAWLVCRGLGAVMAAALQKSKICAKS